MDFMNVAVILNLNLFRRKGEGNARFVVENGIISFAIRSTIGIYSGYNGNICNKIEKNQLSIKFFQII